MLRQFLLIIALIGMITVAWLYTRPNEILFSWKDNQTQSFPDTQKNRFELVEPEMAPPAIRPLVMEGFHIVLETKKNAPEYAGDLISCTNCHFSAGNTLGGTNGGISLVGVTQRYPKKLPSNREYTLTERINDCFERSTNGKPLPNDSPKMKAILAYLDWISHKIDKFSDSSSLGLKKLRSHHKPNVEQGQYVYSTYCSMCHGSDGEGQKRSENLSYPPLWGDYAFNNAAGMNKLITLASFIYENMPYEQPTLTIEEAFDVAAFIISKPRPQFQSYTIETLAEPKSSE